MGRYHFILALQHVHDTLLMLCVLLVLASQLEPDAELDVAREASINLWAWYHRKNNPFFMRDSWGRQMVQTKRALLDFVTFVFSVDVSSAFTESVFSITKGTKDQKRQRLSTEQVANYVRLGSLQRVPARSIPPKVLALNTLEVATYRRKVPGDGAHAVADNTTSGNSSGYDDGAGGDTDDDGEDSYDRSDDDDGD